MSGATVSGRLVVDGQGGLVFRPTTSGPAVAGPIDLIRPGPGVPLRIRTVAVSPSGAVLSATLDPGALSG